MDFKKIEETKLEEKDTKKENYKLEKSLKSNQNSLDDLIHN